MKHSLGGSVWRNEIFEDVELGSNKLLRIVFPQVFVVFREAQQWEQDVNKHVVVDIFQDLPGLRVADRSFHVIQDLLKDPRGYVFFFFLSL